MVRFTLGQKTTNAIPKILPAMGLQSFRLAKELPGISAIGLAKLTEHLGAALDSDAPTVAKITTDAGTVARRICRPNGRAGRGPTPAPTSFSLGVVLYEMIAGRPFCGRDDTSPI